MTRDTRTRPLVRLVLPVAVAGLLLAACGGDDSPAAVDTAPAADSVVDDMTDDSMVDDMTDDSMVDDMTDDSMVDDMTDDSMVDDMTDDSMVDDMTDDSMADHMDDDMTDDSMVDDMVDDMTDDMTDLAAWQTREIIDVDGQAFTLADFAGTPVFVEAFATWCPKCREQLGDTQEAAAALGDDAVVIALSVETDLSAADVASYAADNGFTDVRFAVMTPELLAEMVDDLGNSVANPPSTPHVVIAADGTAGELSTGSISADDIVAALSAA
jgi:thiol-disulfide isomerase/thioredoxin